MTKRAMGDDNNVSSCEEQGGMDTSGTWHDAKEFSGNSKGALIRSSGMQNAKSSNVTFKENIHDSIKRPLTSNIYYRQTHYGYE